MPSLAELAAWARFAAGLPRFLRQRLSAAEAEAIVRRRLADREGAFLRLVDRGVFAHPGSPYRPLFAAAGCELGDVEAMLAGDGLEATLEALRRAGVYVTFEELKGRRPMVRGGRELAVVPRDFDNPWTSGYLVGSTSGSTGVPVRVAADLDQLRATGPAILLSYHNLGVYGVPTCHWRGILPSLPGINSQLRDVYLGLVAERWYSPITRHDLAPSLKDRLATTAVVGIARAMGVAFPWPRPLALDQGAVVAEWGADALRRRGVCLFRGHVSTLLRIALGARERGIDLTGATFLGGGEPPTPGKVAAITATGARFFPTYVMAESSTVGLPCARPDGPEDLHLVEDAIGLITAPAEVPGTGATVDAFHLTTLLPTAPKLLINYRSDDFGVIEERDCGCALHRLGYRRRLREVRSLGKLCGEGVTLVGSDMVKILEQVLPARFGGSAVDYQLVEEEADDGLTRLWLHVHPRLELADERAVVQAVYDALDRSDKATDLARAVWRGAGSLAVRRQPPLWNDQGKLYPVRTLGAARAAAPAAAEPAMEGAA